MNGYVDVPDAPWIREAETYGVVDDADVDIYCPICGAENPEEYLFDSTGTLCGCSECMKRVDAWEWFCEHRDERE